MSFPRYERYRDSGFRWLGEMPSHWQTVPFWTRFWRTKRVNHPEEQLLSAYRDHGVVPKASRDDNNNKPSEDLSTYQLVEVGDLVINKMKAWQGSVAISEYGGIVSPAYFVYSPTHAEDARYLHYLMRSDRYITGYLSMSKGVRIGQWDLDPVYHARMPLLIPRLDEQRIITAFLDRETVKIDALIEELRRLIELLKEKRQTVISHAVTKGLNPDAPMKDSGDGELGRIPQNWRVITLKHFSRLQRGHDLTSDQQEEGPYPVVTSGGISGSHSKYIAKAPGVVTGRYGSTGRLFYLEQDYWPHNTALYVSDFFENYPRFVWYSLQAINFESHSAKSAVPGIDRNDLHVLPVAVPPLHQQLDITAYLDKKMEEFDQLEAETQIAMTLLQERRSALISAAVTGKIDIRNYAPKETHGSA
jgi:type I restriction enzyme, S subunit